MAGQRKARARRKGQVWAYCERAKGRSKIIGKFRRHGEPRVIEAIRALEQQKRLRTVNKGRVKSYEAV